MRTGFKCLGGIFHPKLRFTFSKPRWFCTNKFKMKTESSSFLEKFFDGNDSIEMESDALRTPDASKRNLLNKTLCIVYDQKRLQPMSTSKLPLPMASTHSTRDIPHLTHDTAYEHNLHSFDPIYLVLRPSLCDSSIGTGSAANEMTEDNLIETKNYTVTFLPNVRSLPKEMMEGGCYYSPLTDFERRMFYMADETVAYNKNDASVKSNAAGKPSAEQLDNVYKKLSLILPCFFTEPHDYSLYSVDVIFNNNIRGITTQGIAAYVQQLALVRIVGHLKFAYVRLEVLKITKHVEDGTVRVRWRIRGISGSKVLRNLWKIRLWNWKSVVSEESDWYDGFSTFYLDGNGKVYRHVCDKMMPDDDKEVVENYKGLAAKLAVLLGVVQRPLLDDLNTVLVSLLKLESNANELIAK